MIFREDRGCTAPTNKPVKLDAELDANGETTFKYVFDYCPVNYILPDTKYILILFNLWRQGKMLKAGGIGDQPAKYIDIMGFLDSQWSQMERDRISKMSKGG